MFLEALQSGWPIQAIVVEEGKWSSLQVQFPVLQKKTEVLLASSTEYASMSTQQQSEGIICILAFPDASFGKGNLSIPEHLPAPGLLLEGIQDPGNLGNIMRTADWFGMKHLYCSLETADFLNPKVLRASMGAIFRLQLRYIRDWDQLLARLQPRLWVASMQGIPLNNAPLGTQDYLLMGNEANGVRPETLEKVPQRQVHIPALGAGESLNVATAAAICLYAWHIPTRN